MISCLVIWILSVGFCHSTYHVNKVQCRSVEANNNSDVYKKHRSLASLHVVAVVI